MLGVLTLLLFALNTIMWGCILFLFAAVKLVVPHAGLKQRLFGLLVLIVMGWIEGNSLIIGQACWALDFPFLKRYPRSVLEKHPELRGRDIETARRHCERFKTQPATIVNFLEGTRFTYPKHEKQNSPFRHLLAPRAGGVALVFSAMGEYLSDIIDVTIVYPENEPPVHFWDLLAGKIRRIIVRVEVLPVPGNVAGRSYEEDREYREEIRQWVNRLWQAKDARIEALGAGSRESALNGASKDRSA